MVRSEMEEAFRLEEELARSWGRSGLRRPLVTTWGQELSVVFPGRPNTDRGPDFCGALLAHRDGRLQRGDVEVHLDARSWTSHGHARDARYNTVVLHVVAWTAGATSSRRQDGALIPLLSVASSPPEEAGSGLEPKARWPAAEDLDTLGRERFHQRAILLEGEIHAWGAEEVLYQRLLRALGYAKNTAPFLELAQRLPLGVLRGLAGGLSGADAEDVIAGLFFGVAGFLPSQRGLKAPDGFARRLEAAWRQWGAAAPLPQGSWTTFRVRPENHPVRRVGAATALAQRTLHTDLLAACIAILRSSPPREAGASLGRLLSIGPQGYWAQHQDFNVRRKGRPASLVGPGRAAEMAVSVVLPYLAAYGASIADASLEQAAWAAYLSHGVLGDYGVVQWATGDLPHNALPLRSAVRQQGLLTLAQREVPSLSLPAP